MHVGSLVSFNGGEARIIALVQDHAILVDCSGTGWIAVTLTQCMYTNTLKCDQASVVELQYACVKDPNNKLFKSYAAAQFYAWQNNLGSVFVTVDKNYINFIQ